MTSVLWLAYQIHARHPKATWNDVAELIGWTKSISYLCDLCRAYAWDNSLSWPPAMPALVAAQP